MQLHNPSNVKLPPLFIDRLHERESMESSPNISNLIHSKLLLDKITIETIRKIYNKTIIIKELINSFKKKDASEQFSFSLHRSHFKIPRETPITGIRFKSKNMRHYMHLSAKDIKNISAEYQLKKYKKNIADIKRKSSELQNLLSRFEQQKKVSIDILTPQTLYICKKCHNIIFMDRFRIDTCICGLKVSSTANVHKEPIAYFDSRMCNFIENNFLFEYGVDYLLRKKKFQTLCGVQILGHSGCIHEIDNVAESRSSNFRIFCECKTAEIKTSDVFIFAGKMADIGCSRGYMFTLTKEPQKEIIHLARSRNISIISSVLEKKIDDLITEIKED